MLNGNTIAKLIINTVANDGLDISLCRSQKYDGAGNMSRNQIGGLNRFYEITGN